VHSILDFWEEYFGTELFDVANRIVEDHGLDAVWRAKPYGDVRPALERFRGTLYLASMQSMKVLEIFLDKYSLRGYFKDVLSREGFGSKRSQLQFIIEREEAGSDVILIDDSWRNVSECSKLGVRCILFRRWEGANLLDVISTL